MHIVKSETLLIARFGGRGREDQSVGSSFMKKAVHDVLLRWARLRHGSDQRDMRMLECTREREVGMPRRTMRIQDVGLELANRASHVTNAASGDPRSPMTKVQGSVHREGCVGCPFGQRRAGLTEQQDLVAYSKLDFEFHATVYDACGNEWLRELLETIKNKMRPLTLHVQPDFFRLIDHHAELIKALRGRDPEKAEQAFRRHNQYMMAQIREDVDAGRWKQFGGR